jgi:ABC-2 type transport system ATP-binding protein
MAEADGAAITVEGLKKAYGANLAVDGLSFTVARGEVFGLLGPNGAGKTSTVEMLEGYRAPDAGVARVLGLDPIRDHSALTPRIGVMLQEGGLYPGIRPLEALRLFAAYYADHEDPEALLDLVGLRPVAGTLVRRLSGGQKQRLSLALALVGKPEVVFLDEPTAGMDPHARLTTWDVVVGLKERGATVILTTHAMDEAERLCDRVAIIDGGAIVAEGTPDALKREISGDIVTVGVGEDFAEKAAEVLTGQEYLTGVEVRDGGRLRLAVEAGETAVPRVMRTLDEAGIATATVEVHRPTLDDVFLTKTGRSLRES